jgi:hypothetical protein
MAIKGLKMGSLKPTELTPVPGVISPTKSTMGARTAVQTPKAKKPGQATDKPSQFYKSEDFKSIKKPSIENLRSFLEQNRTKRSKHRA